MANYRRAGLVWFALATVVFLLVAGCKGFFVNPTLTQISVTPAIASISPCSAPVLGIPCTVQLTATGTFNDGSTSPITVTWTPTPAGIVTVNTGGLVSGVAAGSATVQAASGSVSPGTASITVCGVNTTTITISPPGPINVTLSTTPTPSFTATGSAGQNITSQVTWVSSDTGVATISNASGSNGVTQLLGQGTTTITATSCGINSNIVTLNVTI